jgi:hypothetical protein
MGTPGTQVTIAGSGFVEPLTVKFGGTTATVVSVALNSIIAVVPDRNAGTVDVIVTVDGVDSTALLAANDDFTVLAPVQVTQLSPAFGPTTGGTVVTITGTGFVAPVTVTFGDLLATNVTVDSSTQIRATSPNMAAGVVNVRVTVGLVTSPNTPADDFTYTDTPVITSLDPATGPAGQVTLVTIRGTGFLGATEVRFGTVTTTFTVISATEIRAAAPDSLPAGAVDVRIVAPAGTSPVSAAATFLYTGTGALPQVTAVSPSSAPINRGDVIVTITGRNFVTPVTVKFGGLDAPNPEVVNSTTIRVFAPSRATPTVVDVLVTTPAGTSSGAGTVNDFTYTEASGTTFTYNLQMGFSLITWGGKDGITVENALRGIETPDNPNTISIFSRAGAIYEWSPNGVGCPGGQSSCFLAWFANANGVPGAINLFNLRLNVAYWIYVIQSTSWVVQVGN